LQAPIGPVATFGTAFGPALLSELKPSLALVENQPGVEPEVDVGRSAGFPGDTMYDPLCVGGRHAHSTHQLDRIAWGAEAYPLAALCQQRLAETA